MVAGAQSEDLTVLVCSRDRAGRLRDALSAIAVSVDPAVEVVVVDSASTTGETRAVGEAAGRRVVRVERPGLSVARNAGVAATSRSLLAFTDDDCAPSPGWAAALLAPFSEPSVGVVTGRLLAADGGHQITADEGGHPFGYDARVDPARVGVGASMAFRRQALAEIGGFDEALGAGSPLRSAEDHDAIWRVLRAGWDGRYQPDAVVWHQEWRSRWDVVRLQWASGIGAGALAVKIARVDPFTGWPLLHRRIVDEGVVKSVRSLARGWERPALACALYAAGAATGAARTLRRPLTAGRWA